MLTDLSTLGKAGTAFTHDFFLAGTLITFPDEALSVVRKVEGVASATGALTLQVQHQSGTVPNIIASVKTGGEKLTTTARPAAMTAAEQAAVQACVEKSGGFGSTRDAPGARPTPARAVTGAVAGWAASARCRSACRRASRSTRPT